jgi:hypothetical protein
MSEIPTIFKTASGSFFRFADIAAVLVLDESDRQPKRYTVRLKDGLGDIAIRASDYERLAETIKPLTGAQEDL